MCTAYLFYSREGAAMALTCRSLMGLRVFDNIRLAAGEAGLDRIITWPYVKQTRSLKGWLNGGEILFVVDESKGYEEAFYTGIVKEAHRLDVSAIVFLCGGARYAVCLPQEALRLGDKYAIPLFEMPSDIRMIDVTKEISKAIFLWNNKNRQAENLLLNLIHEDYLQGLPGDATGTLYGFDLGRSYFVVVISDKNILQSLQENDMLALTNRFSVITMRIQAECDRHGDQFISTMLCGTAICCLSVRDEAARRSYIAHIGEQLTSYNMANACDLQAGASRLHKDLGEMPRAYEEGRQALRYRMKRIDAARISAYEDMGIMQFLISSKDKNLLIEYSNDLLKDLVALERKENTEYVKTLWYYLRNNNSLVRTAQALFIHRNTLVNRINKIQSIIGKDLGDVDTKVRYLNAFSILEFYGLMDQYSK